jgi:hypothetical protein
VYSEADGTSAGIACDRRSSVTSSVGWLATRSTVRVTVDVGRTLLTAAPTARPQCLAVSTQRDATIVPVQPPRLTIDRWWLGARASHALTIVPLRTSDSADSRSADSTQAAVEVSARAARVVRRWDENRKEERTVVIVGSDRRGSER